MDTLIEEMTIDELINELGIRHEPEPDDHKALILLGDLATRDDRARWPLQKLVEMARTIELVTDVRHAEGFRCGYQKAQEHLGDIVQGVKEAKTIEDFEAVQLHAKELEELKGEAK